MGTILPFPDPNAPPHKIMACQVYVEAPSGRRIDAMHNVLTNTTAFVGHAEQPFLHEGKQMSAHMNFEIEAADIVAAFAKFEETLEPVRKEAIEKITAPKIITPTSMGGLSGR
jgi:hypothetical protein